MKTLNKQTNLYRLTVTAVLLALGTVLSLFKLWTLPLGGSVTLLSMLPVFVLTMVYGVKWGLVSSFLYAVLQIGVDLYGMMGWGMTATLWVGALVFDYLIPYGFLGLAGIWRKKGIVGIALGIAFALLLRFCSHFISGVIFFDIWCPEDWNPAWYSVCYNGSFVLPELILTEIGAIALFKSGALKRLFGDLEA